MAREPIWKKLKAKFERAAGIQTTRRPLRPPTLGHRGVAIGSTTKPDLSQENIDRWQMLSADEVASFLYDGTWLQVHSTNVKAFRYEIDKRVLHVAYLDGSTYGYADVSEEEAVRFATAQSKGSEVWDTLRVRGSKTGARKPYWREH